MAKRQARKAKRDESRRKANQESRASGDQDKKDDIIATIESMEDCEENQNPAELGK